MFSETDASTKVGDEQVGNTTNTSDSNSNSNCSMKFDFCLKFACTCTLAELYLPLLPILMLQNLYSELPHILSRPP